jgi:hypothetical protein
MATIESDKMAKALLGKMQAERLDSVDWRYVVSNDQGKQVSVTRISKGSKHTLGDKRISLMARQLGLDTAQQLRNLVSCSLSREEALKIMEANNLPGASQ